MSYVLLCVGVKVPELYFNIDFWKKKMYSLTFQFVREYAISICIIKLLEVAIEIQIKIWQILAAML